MVSFNEIYVFYYEFQAILWLCIRARRQSVGSALLHIDPTDPDPQHCPKHNTIPEMCFHRETKQHWQYKPCNVSCELAVNSPLSVIVWLIFKCLLTTSLLLAGSCSSVLWRHLRYCLDHVKMFNDDIYVTVWLMLKCLVTTCSLLSGSCSNV